MDTTERILKLAALGWDGKEPELEFFQRVYGVNVEVTSGSNMTVITISYGKYGKSRIRVRKKIKEVDPVQYCLRLFRTINGEPVGPKSKLFISEDQEWT